ncbi:MAG: hypothetical protein ACK5K7_04515 [Bacilli bacterium]
MYNVFCLKELEQLCILKNLKYNRILKSKTIICYISENKIQIEYIKGIVDNKLVLSSTIIEKPQKYLCISNKLDSSIYNKIIFYFLSLLSIIAIFINIKVSFLIYIGIINVKSNAMLIINNLLMILFLHLMLYKDYYVLLAVILVIFSFKFKFFIYFSAIFLLFNKNIIGNNLVYCYILNLLIFKTNCSYNKLSGECNMLKLLIKKPISKIDNIIVDDIVLEKYGRYFFEIRSSSMIFINGINLKFISLPSISSELKIIYIANENSFFTNRQKYSKIEGVDKYYIYLYEYD